MGKPEPSEWGKLNAGQVYGILATDIGRAIFAVPWGKHLGPVVFYLIEHSWGVARTKTRDTEWPDPAPCAINWPDLARQWGRPKQRLYEARDWLVACRFAIEVGGGYMINKNAHEWKYPGTDDCMVDPAMLTYAASSRTRWSEPDQQTSDTLQRDQKSRRSVTADAPISKRRTRRRVTKSHGAAYPSVTAQRDSESRCAVTFPIEVHAQDSRDLRRQGDVGGGGGAPPACEPVTDRHGEVIDLDCGIVNDPAEVERVAEWAVQAFNGFQWGMQVRAYAKTYPAGWIELALQNARAWTTPPRSFTPILNDLRRWQLAGGPPAIEASAPAPGQPPAAPSKQAQKIRDFNAGLDGLDF